MRFRRVFITRQRRLAADGMNVPAESPGGLGNHASCGMTGSGLSAIKRIAGHDSFGYIAGARAC